VPAEEPDWEQMASDIRAACAQPRPGLWQRLRAALAAPLRDRRGQAALGLAVTAVAALVIVLLVGRDRQPAPVELAATGPDAAVAEPGEDLRVAEVEDLDEAELEALEVALAPGRLAAGTQDGGVDDPGEDPLAIAAAEAGLTPEELAEWAQLSVSAAPAEGQLELGMFEDSGYDDWLAGMSESDLDVLDEALADG